MVSSYSLEWKDKIENNYNSDEEFEIIEHIFRD